MIHSGTDNKYFQCQGTDYKRMIHLGTDIHLAEVSPQ
jgi:hypothetical protein